MYEYSASKISIMEAQLCHSATAHSATVLQYIVLQYFIQYKQYIRLNSVCATILMYILIYIFNFYTNVVMYLTKLII